MSCILHLWTSVIQKTGCRSLELSLTPDNERFEVKEKLLLKFAVWVDISELGITRLLIISSYALG